MNCEFHLHVTLDLDPETAVSLDRLVSRLVAPETPINDRRRARRWLLRHLVREATYAAEDAGDQGDPLALPFGFNVVRGHARAPAREKRHQQLESLLTRLLREDDTAPE